MTNWFDEIKKMIREEQTQEACNKVFRPMGIEPIYFPGGRPRLELKYSNGFSLSIERMFRGVVSGKNLYRLTLKDPDGHIILTKEGDHSTNNKTAKQVKLLIQKTMLQTKIMRRRSKWAW